MRTFRRLLLESFENELNEANQYFISAVNERDNLTDEFLCVLKDKYNFLDIQDFFVGHFPKVLQRKDLVELAGTFFDEKYAYAVASDNSRLMYIPIFKFLFDNKSYDFDEFCKIYMAMHLTKDKFATYENGPENFVKVPFSFDIIDKMDLMLNSRDFFIGINTVIEMLDFIEYENQVNNNEKNREYLDSLNGIVDKLHNYLSFWSTNDEISKLIESKNTGKKYSLNEQCDNLLFAKFVLGKNFYTKNPVMLVDEIESLLQTGDENQLKKNLIVAFAYKEYNLDDSFFEAFKDVSLSIEDIRKVIADYEKTGKVLSSDQFGNIIKNYKNSFLAREDEKEYCLNVKNVYDRFRSKDFISSDLDFIKQFNEEFGTLTLEDFERIIKGNYLYDYESLSRLRSFKNYSSDTGFKIESKEDIEKKYILDSQRREYIYNKYFELLFLHQDSVDETMEYFVRNNVLDDDILDFNKLKTWFEHNKQFTGWNNSKELYARCAIKLLDDFENELHDSKFMDRQAVYSKYLKYAVNDGVGKFATARDIKKIFENYETSFKIENAWALLGEVCIAYENKESLADRIFYLGLSLDDALDMFSILEKNADFELSNVIRNVSSKLSEDDIEREKKCQEIMKKEQCKMYMNLVSDYLSTEGLTAKTYCSLIGIPVYKLKKAVDYCCENGIELAEQYKNRARLVRSGCFNPDRMDASVVNKVASGIISGVTMEDGTVRDYNYLDYKLTSDLPIGLVITTILNAPEFRYSEEEINKIREFTLKYTRPKYYKEETILKTKEELNIDGVSTEIDNNMKQAAFDYIDSLELPHEIKLYNIVIRGIADGSIKQEVTSKRDEKVFEKNLVNEN